MIRFTELQNFGVNALTFTFIATVIFTVLQIQALWKQNEKIVKSRSGESVSFIFFAYYSFAALAVIIYGLYEHSLALTINGFVGFITLAIIINLLRLQVISLMEKIIGLSSIIILPLIIFLPQRDLLFLIVGSIVNGVLLIQVIKIWQNKSSGSIHSGPTIVAIFSNSFWLSYAFAANIWPMKIINSVGLLLWLALLIVYLKFKPKKINISE